MLSRRSSSAYLNDSAQPSLCEKSSVLHGLAPPGENTSFLADEPLWIPGRIGHIVLVVSVLAGLGTENKRAQTVIVAIVMCALAYIAITRLWNPR